MIFFMVSHFSSSRIIQKYFSFSTISYDENRNNYTTYVFSNPFHNRKHIAEVAKNKAGVYIFTAKDGSNYVGSSSSLYSRVTSYFMPSVLLKANRRVLRYFSNYGFRNIQLTLHILHENSSITSLQLEQYFIDTIKPNLNVDLIASSTGFHEPISEYWRSYFRKARGIGIYIYDIRSGKLVFVSDSIQYITDHVGLHRSSILRYSQSNKLYLSCFRIVRDYIPELDNTSPLTIDKFKTILEDVREEYTNAKVQPKSKPLLAVNINNPTLTKKYPSILSFAKSVKGDSTTIRKYIQMNSEEKLYRQQWRLTILDEK